MLLGKGYGSSERMVEVEPDSLFGRCRGNATPSSGSFAWLTKPLIKFNIFFKHIDTFPLLLSVSFPISTETSLHRISLLLISLVTLVIYQDVELILPL